MPRDTSRPKSQWSVPEERLGGIEIAQDRDESFGGAHCLTVDEAERIVENLTKINAECVDEELSFTRAVLMYMLKELHDVFGSQDAFVEEDSKAAAIENRTQEANADEEGLAGRKRQRSLPATALPATG